MVNLFKGKAGKDKRNDSQDPAVNAAALEDVGATSAQTSQSGTQQHQQAQEVIDMMVRKHHERHPHSKDADQEISSIPYGMPDSPEQGAQEDEDDEDGMFKFAPPQSGGIEQQPATEPLQPLPSTPPSGVSASHSQQHDDNIYPPHSVASSALDPHSHIDATAPDDGLSPAARYAQQVQSNNRPTTAISTKSGLGKRRQPFVYPGSPIYTTAGTGHQQLYNRQEHLNEHDLPMAQREGTPVIGMADGSGFPVSVQGTPRSAFLPEYKSQLDDGEDGYSHRTGASSFMTKARSRSLKAGKGSGGMASVQEWDGQDSPDLYKLNEYAMQDLNRDGGYTTAIPTSRGEESNISPSIGYTASRRPMTAALSSRGATAISAIDGDKHSISGYDLYEGVDEDSPFPEVRASVSNIDDPEMPVLTFRSWFLGIFFLILGGCLNFFFNIRFPSPLISPVTVQLLSYPFGKLLSYTLPTKSVKTPAFLRYIGFPEDLSLNPGPFNIKEHTIVVMIANVTLSPPYALNLTLVLDRFYKQPKGIGFDFLIVLSTQIIGFSFAGLCRRYLVWPGSMVWPQNLVTCTLFNTFHAEDDDGSDGSLTRFRYFTYVIIAGFLWFLLPGYLFTGLSVFSYICWIFPRQKVVNQLFGISTGLGMSGITFDWAQIAYTGSPLVVPWFAAVNIFAGFCIIYWVIVPILYYSNAWNFAYMPISVSGNFDRFGQYYNVSMVTNDDMSFNQEKYEAYSPLFMSTTYAIVYGISFCLATASIMHVLLYSGKDIYQKFRKTAAEDEDVHMKLMRNYPEVADWWYWLIFLVCTVLAIIAVEVYDTGLTVWALFLAILVPAVYILPGGYIFAITAQILTVNLVSEVIPGYALPGRPVANMLFKAFSVQGLQSGLYFVQDLKLGHYMKIPPRASFIAQIVGITISCFVQVGMKRAMESLVPDLCADDQHALLVCPISHVAFEASVIWGLIGPERFFGHGSPYRPLLYLLLLGVVLPIPFFFMARKWPESWVRHINIPVMLNGATWIPPATGINYSSWFLVSAVFQFWLRRRRFRWWSKFNFVTSCALEAGTILSALFIFFALQLPREGTIELKWWGNEVYKRTADWVGVPYRDTPEAGFGPESWY